MACVRQLRKGRWKYDFRDDDGKRHVVQTFRTREEAERALRECQEKLDRGSYVPTKKLPTFGELAAEWFDGKRNHHPATRAAWQVHIENHLVPHVGAGRRLDRIDPTFIEKRVRDALAAKKLGSRTVNKILTTGGAIFKLALRRGLVERNPFAVAERLKEGAGELREDADRAVSDGRVRPEDVPRTDELRKLLQYAAPGLYKTLFRVTALTGCRPSELRALRWENVDLEAAIMKIRRAHTYAHVRGEERRSEGRFYGPKTKAGIRDISMEPALVASMKQWKLRCPPTSLGLVFPGPKGTPLHESTVLRQGLYPALDEAGLPHFDLYALRHYFASFMILGGAPVTEVAHLLGHTDPSVTLRRYAHWFRRAKSGAMTALAEAVYGRD